MTKKLSAPVALVLVLTDKCNLRCEFCGVSSFPSVTKNSELTNERWIEIIKELAGLKLFYLTLTGGEIFTRNGIFDILKVACDLLPNKVKINTNGTLLSEEDVSKLSTLNFHIVGTSIDGVGDVHDALRGNGNYEKTIKFIKWMVDRQMKFEVCFVPTKKNFRDFPRVIDILLSLGVRNFDYNTLSPEGRACVNYNDLLLSYPEEQKEFMELVKSINNKHGLNLPYKYDKYLKIEEKYNYYKEKGKLDQIESPSIWQCSAGISSCFVTADGWLAPCTPFIDFVGENIKEMSFEEAWRLSNWDNITSLSNIKTSELAECKNCKYNNLCGSGCRAINYQFTGSLLAADINCPFKSK